MTEYISLKAAIEAIMSEPTDAHYPSWYADKIESISVADVVPVRHGRWKEMHYKGGILDGINFDRCSICGYERVFDDPALKTVFKYCPNCGAKMDGE